MFNNAITTQATQLNGSDSVLYDGVMSKVYSNVNTKTAVLMGYSVSMIADLGNKSQAYLNLAYTKGTITSEIKDVPLDHIAPITGNIGYLYNLKAFTGEINMQFNGKKDISTYSNSGEDNQIYAPKGGMPAWNTFNLKLAYKITSSFVLQAGVDNILDTNYRVFASGINAPGRNFYAALRFSM